MDIEAVKDNTAGKFGQGEGYLPALAVLPVVAVAALIAAFIYSGRSLFDCLLIAAGAALITLSMYNICRDCEMKFLPSSAAAFMLAFSPFITELAILNPALPLISGGGLFAFSLWVRSLAWASGRLNAGFLFIVLPAILWAVVFSLLANPAFMSELGFKTFYPMPVSERPYPALAAVTASMYKTGLPVAAGYLMLLLVIPGMWKLSYNSLLVCGAALIFAIPCFDKSLFEIPPGMWAVFPMAGFSLLAANGAANAASLIEDKYHIRPFWIMIIPVAEVLGISYIMTY